MRTVTSGMGYCVRKASNARVGWAGTPCTNSACVAPGSTGVGIGVSRCPGVPMVSILIPWRLSVCVCRGISGMGIAVFPVQVVGCGIIQCLRVNVRKEHWTLAKDVHISKNVQEVRYGSMPLKCANAH